MSFFASSLRRRKSEKLSSRHEQALSVRSSAESDLFITLVIILLT